MNTGDMKYQHTMKNKLGGLRGILTNINTGDMKYQHTMKNKLGGLRGILTNINTGDMKYQHTMKNTLGGLPFISWTFLPSRLAPVRYKSTGNFIIQHRLIMDMFENFNQN